MDTGTSVFLLAVALASIGALLVLRTRSHEELGVALFGSLYVIFAAGFFAASPAAVVSLWLILALANIVLQYRALPRQPGTGFAPAVLFASLFLWPVQLASLRIHRNQESARSVLRETSRGRLGELPGTVSGTVAFVHHIGSETGEEMVWLEEYEELEFWMSSQLCDTIGMVEGRRVSLSVEERAGVGPDPDRTVLWVVDGTAFD